jgi:hypothetical protein
MGRATDVATWLIYYRSREVILPTPRAPREWWAHLVGALRVHPHNIAPTILRKKIEDLREAGAPVSIRAEYHTIGWADEGKRTISRVNLWLEPRAAAT